MISSIRAYPNIVMEEARSHNDNEIAWGSLSTDHWVTFKVFGITGISLVFTVISVPIMTRHQIEE